MRYCGREFSEADIERIRSLMASCPGMHRRALSRRFCEEVGWRKADGQPKEMSCRVALLRMQRDGHILLPAPRRAHYPPSKEVQRTLFALPKPPVEKPAGAFCVFPARMRKWAMDGVFTEPGGLTGGARRCNSRAASSGDCERLLWSAFATPRGN